MAGSYDLDGQVNQCSTSGIVHAYHVIYAVVVTANLQNEALSTDMKTFQIVHCQLSQSYSLLDCSTSTS